MIKTCYFTSSNYSSYEYDNCISPGRTPTQRLYTSTLKNQRCKTYTLTLGPLRHKSHNLLWVKNSKQSSIYTIKICSSDSNATRDNTTLITLHKQLCHPGVTHLLQYCNFLTLEKIHELALACSMYMQQTQTPLPQTTYGSIIRSITTLGVPLHLLCWSAAINLNIATYW